MNKIDHDELYGHLSEFLKAKGVALQDGSYARRIQQGCRILTGTINQSQQALERAKAEVDRRMDQVRQAIHEKTAPKPPTGQPQPEPSSPQADANATTTGTTKSAAGKSKNKQPKRPAPKNAKPGAKKVSARHR